MEDKKVKKVLKDRLKREFEKLTKEKRPMPQVYLIGYRTAIADCLWDLFGEVLKFDNETLGISENIKKLLKSDKK